MNTTNNIPSNILVTGGNGMLGSKLTRLLNQLDTVSEDAVYSPDHQTLDITRTAQIRALILQKEIDLLINTAAYTDVDGCETNEKHAMAVNAEAPGKMATIAADHGVKFVHYSTDYVFQGTSEEPYTETDPTDPINMYGQSKEKGEKLVMEHHPNAILIRTAWLYGQGGNNFIRTIYENLQNNQEVQIVTDQQGSPTSTKTVAEATIHLIREQEKGLYHVTNTGSTNWFEVGKEIASFLDKPELVQSTTSDALDRDAPRPAFSVLSTKKLQKSGYTPLHWKESLNDYLESIQ